MQHNLKYVISRESNFNLFLFEKKYSECPLCKIKILFLYKVYFKDY